MVFTDPPYGIDYADVQGRFDPIEGDNADPTPIVAAALSHLAPGLPAYVCCDWRSLEAMRAALQQAGHAAKATIVWDKERGVQNLDLYFKQHEFIIYAGPYGGQPTLRGDVWRVPREPNPGDHPTPKPVALVAMALTDASSPRSLILDPFLGSGTTLIAAEQLGRRCYGLEIEPKYVDVIIARWEALTGKKATLEEAKA